MSTKSKQDDAPPRLIDLIKTRIDPNSEEFVVIGADKKSPGNFAFAVSPGPERVAYMVVGFLQQLHPDIRRFIIEHLPDEDAEKRIVLPRELDS